MTKVVQQTIYDILSLTGRVASGDIQRNASLAIIFTLRPWAKCAGFLRYSSNESAWAPCDGMTTFSNINRMNRNLKMSAGHDPSFSMNTTFVAERGRTKKTKKNNIFIWEHCTCCYPLFAVAPELYFIW